MVLDDLFKLFRDFENKPLTREGLLLQRVFIMTWKLEPRNTDLIQ